MIISGSLIWSPTVFQVFSLNLTKASKSSSVSSFFSATKSFFASVSVRKSVLDKSRLRVIIFRSQRRRRRRRRGSRIHLLARDKGIGRMPRGGFSRDTNGYQSPVAFRGRRGAREGKGGFSRDLCPPWSLINPSSFTSFTARKAFDPSLQWRRFFTWWQVDFFLRHI